MANTLSNKKQQSTAWYQNPSKSTSSYMEAAGVQGKNGGGAVTVNNSAQNIREEGEPKPDMTVTSSGTVGLIPGTKAYADAKRAEELASTNSTDSTGGGTIADPNAQPAPTIGVTIGGGRTSVGNGRFKNNMLSGKTIPQSLIDQIPEDVRGQVVSVLQSGPQAIQQYARDNFSVMQQPWAKAIMQHLAVNRGGGVRGQMIANARSRGQGGDFQSWENRWMGAVRDRAWEKNNPPPEAAPPVQGPMIRPDQLPPGYTPINGRYDPETGEPLVSEARGPDGSVWRIGEDGMPVQISSATQPLYNDAMMPPVDENGNQIQYSDPSGYPSTTVGTPYPGIPGNLPPELMSILTGQLPYFGAYLAGTGGMYPPQQ